MKAYKGFDKNMTCRGFQFEEGKEYTEEKAELCKSGFHACEYPLDVFGYYAPSESVYHEVELDGITDKREDDTKLCGTRIKIGAHLSVAELVDLSVEYIKSKANPSKNQSVLYSAATNTGDYSAATNTGDHSAATNTGNRSAATNTGYHSAATNTGDQSAATNTGDYSAATNTGNRSAATNTGYHSAATNTGDQSAATNTGYQSAATNTGDRSAATNTGYHSAATNTGDRSAATNTGHQSAATNTGDQSAATVSGKEAVAMAIGYASRAMGAIGCWIVLAEWDAQGSHIIDVKCARVDGEAIKADTFYTLKNGEFVEDDNNAKTD